MAKAKIESTSTTTRATSSRGTNSHASEFPDPQHFMQRTS